jgi:hypothetical protein
VPPGGDPPANENGGQEERAAVDWPWLLLAVLAVAACWPVLRRLRAPAPRPFEPAFAERVIEPAALDDGGNAADDPNGEPEVRELWAAAALLGEAVGRLKQSAGGPTTPGAREEAVHEAEIDDLFVLDDGTDDALDDALDDAPDDAQNDAPTDEPNADLAEVVPPVAAPEPPSELAPVAAATAVTDAPTVLRLRLPTTGSDHDAQRDRLLQALAQDPRVLIAPEPQLSVHQGEFRLSFGLVPDVPAGERALLEQRLRDAVA